MPDLLSFVSDPQFYGLIVSGILSVLLAVFVQSLQSRHRESEERKKTAAILGYEIASIKVLANQARQVDRYTLDIYKKAYGRSELNSITIGDVNFPRAMYDKPSINLTLFEPQLAATISELYRWVDFSSHVKGIANDYSMRIAQIMSKWRGATHDLTEEAQVHLFTEQFIKAAEGYIHNLERISEYSQNALTGLNKITIIDESKVKGDSFPQLPHIDSARARGKADY